MEENKGKKDGQYPEKKLLHGKIPGTDSEMYFTEEKVADEGDCGFIGLGYDREPVAEVLLGLSLIDEIRAELWQEIAEAFETNRIPRTSEFETLFNAFQEPNLPHEIYDERRKALEEYCTQKEVFEYYVNEYRGKLWLGYKSALIFAKEKNMTLYIWKKDNDHTISILESNIQERAQGTVHLLLTRGYSHYNLLVEAPRLEKVNANSEEKKKPSEDSKNKNHETQVHVTPEATIKFDGEDFYSAVDKLEKPILESVKPYGYRSIEKTDSGRKLIKDDGSCIEIMQSGEMSALVNLGGDPDVAAKECAKKFIAMIMIYHEIVKERGKDKAFPSGSLDMNIKDVSTEINSLVKMYVKRELAKPPLDGINDKFTYNGEVFFAPSAKADTKGHAPTLLKPPREMRDNASHGLKENNGASNSMPSNKPH